MDPPNLANRLECFFSEGQLLLSSSRELLRSSLHSFFSEAASVLVSARGEILEHERLHASRFNVFDSIAPDENTLSNLLADLLDPHGKHGQGAAFLELLLNRCEVKLPGSLSQAKIHREAPTTSIARDSRRIDIRIDFDTFGLGIENKPWAADQPGQVRDYLQHLDKQHGGRFLLLYLSGSGEPPADHSVTAQELDLHTMEGRFRMWTFAVEFADWLAEAEPVCQAERVRWFLRDFRDYIRQNFKRPELRIDHASQE